MKKCLFLIFLSVLGYAQVNWQYEQIDSVSIYESDLGRINRLAIDTNGNPGVVYCSTGCLKMFYAYQFEDSWHKELVDAQPRWGYGYSLLYDFNNIAHLSYYKEAQPPIQQQHYSVTEPVLIVQTGRFQ
jgi:hypothetical protein